MEIFYAGEQDAGQQEQKPGLSAGIPQQIDRDRVVQQGGEGGQRRKEQRKAQQAAAEHPARRPPLPLAQQAADRLETAAVSPTAVSDISTE